MTINGVNSAAVPAGQGSANCASDPVSKALQKQIADVQRRIQEVSADKEMTTEEKMKRRQELAQQIQDLNNQLRQHQIELRREKQQKSSGEQEMSAQAKKADAGQQAAGLSATGMNAMMSADASIKQARVQGGVAVKLEGRAGVLESEIKLDGQRGGDVSAKKEELADVEQKAENAAAAQLDTLAGAYKEMKDASQAQDDDAPNAADRHADEETGAASGRQEQAADADRDAASADAESSARMHYVPVDVRL